MSVQSVPIKLHCHFADGTEQLQELTDSQRVELVSLLGEALVPCLDHRQDRFGGVVQSVSVNITLSQWAPSGEGYLGET